MAKPRWKRWLVLTLAGLVSSVALLLGYVKVRYGGGDDYPDVSTEPLLEASRLQTVVELQFPPGNVTASPDGRVFFNYHPFAEPARFTNEFIFELIDGRPRVFPNAEMQSQLHGVLGMTVDRQNRLWMIRPAGLEDRPTRLFGFDLATGEKVVDATFADGVGPFAQDLRVSPDGKTIILADTGIFRFTPAALIVFDIETRTARRVLEAHESVAPQNWVMRTRWGPHKLGWGLVTFQVGVDGVAISADGVWLYYATMSHDTAYRIKMADLRNPALDDAQLAQGIERIGKKPLSDGIEIDGAGSLYITDVENGGVMKLDANGGLKTLVKSTDVVWADGIARTATGDLLFTDSAIPAYIDPLARPPASDQLEAARPFRIYRVDL